MMLYLWEDTDTPETELKFGEHFLESDSIEKATEHTKKYIRSSLARQKYKFDQGRIKIHHIWDASDYAKHFDKFKPHSKLDDFIRNKLILGQHIERTEIHRFISAEDFIIKINEELKNYQNLPVAGLSTKQYEQLENVISSFGSGSRVILAELCARFGKTIWAGSVIKETESNLTVIASYVLTSFSSFIKEFTTFNQFKDFVLIDTKDEKYEEKIRSALSDDKQVVAFLSMCTSEKRDERVNFLYSLGIDVLTIIDEADYGVQHPNQSSLLITNQKSNDCVILMTGTGADRAVGDWDIDYHTSVTYIELLAEKNNLELA